MTYPAAPITPQAAATGLRRTANVAALTAAFGVSLLLGAALAVWIRSGALPAIDAALADRMTPFAAILLGVGFLAALLSAADPKGAAMARRRDAARVRRWLRRLRWLLPLAWLPILVSAIFGDMVSTLRLFAFAVMGIALGALTWRIAVQSRSLDRWSFGVIAFTGLCIGALALAH